jgi:hypothetical protein
MNSNDIILIDKLIARIEDLPKVLDLRIKAKWENLTEEEAKFVFETYQELDDILNDLLTFINVKFHGRNDLIHAWNKIDFEPEIASMRVNTNSPEMITKAWNGGIYDLKSLMKNLRREIILIIDENHDKKSQSVHIQNSNVVYGNVNDSTLGKNIRLQKSSDENIAFKSYSWQKYGVYLSLITLIITIVIWCFQ